MECRAGCTLLGRYEKMSSPPLYTPNTGPMKNFVKFLEKDGRGFRYLQGIFSNLEQQTFKNSTSSTKGKCSTNWASVVPYVFCIKSVSHNIVRPLMLLILAMLKQNLSFLNNVRLFATISVCVCYLLWCVCFILLKSAKRKYLVLPYVSNDVIFVLIVVLFSLWFTDLKINRKKHCN